MLLFYTKQQKKIGTRNVHVATAVYNYRFYFESLGVKHLEIPTCCSREEPSDQVSVDIP